MLRVIEYTLLGVSLLVVIGLIVGGSRSKTDASATPPSALPGETDEAPQPGKSA